MVACMRLAFAMGVSAVDIGSVAMATVKLQKCGSYHCATEGCGRSWLVVWPLIRQCAPMRTKE